MRILNKNYLSDGTLSYSSQLEKYQFSDAFDDTDLTRWGKFASNSGQYLQVSFSEAKTIYYAYILNTNFSDEATVTLQCSNDSFATVAAEYALTYRDGDWFYCNEGGLSYSSFRLSVTDTSVTYPRLSKIYLGGYTELQGVNPEVSTTIKDKSKSDKTDSGQLRGYNVVQLRKYKITLDIITKAEKTAIETLFETWTITPYVVLTFEDSLDDEPPLYANASDDSIEFKQLSVNGLLYSGSLEYEECK